MAAPRVIVLADDLIWSTRLVSLLSALGADAVHARDDARFEAALLAGDRAVVDLTARAYDGVRAIERATARGLRVIAVAQHDDAPLRRRALESGAERVFAYRKLFDDGERTLGTWLGVPASSGAR